MLSVEPKPGDGTSQSASPEPAGAGESIENRSAPRRAASAMPSITGLRFSPQGLHAVLVDISETGMLAECGERVKPGGLTVVFDGTFEPRRAEGRVVRNSVLSMGADGSLRYLIGIEFTAPIYLEPIDDAPPPQVEESAVVVPRVVRNRW
jgi:hypothetical protein